MLDLYFGSGSPPGWRVQLALEHKGLPYRPHLLSFGKQEHKTAEYLAINPRGKVPAIVDDGFALYESNAIVEYLDAKYPERPLYPRDAQLAAVTRRLIHEADLYLYPATTRVSRQVFGSSPDAYEIAEGSLTSSDELERFASYLANEYFVGELSAADFAIYPMLAIVDRRVNPKLATPIAIPPRLADWMKRIEALPYYGTTYPPHWRG